MGLSSLFPKKSSEEEKKLQQFGKAFVNLKVVFSKMPPVNSVVQWRNWAHPRSSCLFLILSPAVPRLPKGFNPFSCPLPLSSEGSSLSSLPNSSSSSNKGERNPCPGFEGLLESSSGVTQLTLPRQVCGQFVGAFPIE